MRVWVSPEGAVVLLAAVVTAVVAQMPIVLLPGLMAYAVLAYLRYTRRRDEGAALAPVAVDLSALPAPYATRVRRAAAHQELILAELSGANDEQQALLTGTAERVRHLVEAAQRMAEKLAELDRHLRAQAGADEEDAPALGKLAQLDRERQRQRTDRETRQLQEQLAAATDPEAREAYTRALAQQEQKEAVLTELMARRERLDAQLWGVEKTLDTVAAQVVRIKSAEGPSVGAEGARINEALDALAVEVDAAAETVEEAAAGYAEVRRR